MAERLCVLMLVKSMDIGGKAGGSDKYGLDLSLTLKQNGLDVVVCCLNQSGSAMEESYRQRLASAEIPCYFIHGRSTLQKLFSRQLPKICTAHAVDLAHAHFPIGTLISLRLKALHRVWKTVRTAHISKEWGQGVIPALFRLAFTRCLFPLLVDAQVGVSRWITHAMQGYFCTRISGHQVWTVHNGISSTWFQPSEHSRAIDGQRQNIMALGLLIPRKGFNVLIAAMPAVLRAFPQARLSIIGEGEARPALEEQVRRLALSECVSLPGSRSDIQECFTQTDLFVLPSLVEGFPTVILESMASRVAVVATDISGTNELVIDGETGWLAAPHSVDGLADAMVKALGDSQTREQMAERAYLWAQEFTIEKAALQYAEIYRELLRG